MTKYEIHTDEFEHYIGNSSIDFSPKDCWELYKEIHGHKTTLEEEFTDKAKALNKFKTEYSLDKSAEREGSYAIIHVAYVMESEYTKEGDFDQGNIIEWSAEFIKNN